METKSINKKLPPKTESHVIREVRDYLELYGWLVFRNHQGLGNRKGRPDLEAFKDGLTLFIECKSEKGKLSPEQENIKSQIEHKGHIYIVARKYEDVEEVIKKIYFRFIDSNGNTFLTIKPSKKMRWDIQ